MTNKISFVFETVFLLISLTVVLLQTVSSEPDQIHFRGGRCTPYDNFTPNATYHTNLRSLLSKFDSESSNLKFFNLSFGVGVNRVNGLYHCRPDLSLETCHACIKDAMQVLSDKCTIKKEAILWYDECTIRYTNRSAFLFSTEEMEPSTWAFSTLNVSKPEVFTGLLNRTMQRLISKATTPSNALHFATSKNNFTWFEGLYGLALCTPDITNFECEKCLRMALSIFPSCCGELSQFAMVFLPDCQLRYDTAPFIFDTPATPSALTPASTG